MFKYRIYLYSPLRAAFGRKDKYAPTQWPTFEAKNKAEVPATKLAAAQFARNTLKLDENLQGKQAFEIRLA